MRSRSLHNKLFINCPIPFRLQQLPLARQKKDKQIKQQRLELEKKRKQYEDIQLHWKMAQTQFKQFSLQQKQQNEMLKLKDATLRKDLFRLAIRRDQVQSRNNPEIAKSRGKILKQYLFCVPFSVGNRLECVKFWESEDRFMHLSFLLQFVLDRKLCRTEVQKHIKSNLECIVYCNKVKFNNKLVMLCIKEIGQSKQILKDNNRLWNSGRKDERRFQVMVYAVTGRYFCIKKVYSYQDLVKFAVSLGSVISIKLNRRRLSVADNLIKANVLKSLASQKSESSSKISSPKVTYQLISESSIIKEGVDQGVSDESSSSELESSSEQEKGSQCFIQKMSQVSNEQLSESPRNVISGESQQSIPTEKLSCQTKKQLSSKSSFYHNAKPEKSEEKQICKLNKQFLMGHQVLLFPSNQPLFNLVVFITQRQLYLLPEYIDMPQKKTLLIQSLAKFRLKMKLKAEIKKCLLYRVVDLNIFYETEMFRQKNLEMKFLFVIKRQDTPEARQINLYCDSITVTKLLQKAIAIKHNMLRQVIDKLVGKDEKNNNRNSNNKGLRKDSPHRSRESRKKDKNQMKLSVNQNQKSNVVNKFDAQEWVPFSQKINCKLQQFLKNNLLNIRLHTFIPVMQLNIKKKIIVKIQARARGFVQRIKHKRAIAHYGQRKCNYQKLNDIIITALSILTKEIIVYVQSIQRKRKNSTYQFRFSSQYSEIIFKAVKSFHNQGSLIEVKDRVSQHINNSIQFSIQQKARRQAERPEKNKRVLQRFIFVTYLRLRARKNVFFVKKIAVRQKRFLLIIRRDSIIRSLLECNLYEIPNGLTSQCYIGSICSGKQSKDIVSQYGFHKPFPHSSRELVCGNHRYQTIHLMDQYFMGIDKKNICEQFFIDRGVFLLKPQKSPSIYYIQRLSSIDINSDDVIKQVNAFHREEQSQLHKHANQSTMLQSNLSLKKTSPSHMFARRDSTNSRFKQKIVKDIQQKKGSAKQKGKKISIEGVELMGLAMFQSNFLMQKAAQTGSRSKVSLADTDTHRNGKQLFKIVGNSHESTVYFSLFKSEDIFFYIQFFIVSRIKNQKGYSQELTFIDKQRIYKKQLQEHGMTLIPKRLAHWIHSNQADFIQIKEKDRMVEVSRKDLGDGLL